MEVASGILNFASSKLASKILEDISSTLGVKKSLDEVNQIVGEIKSVLQIVGDKVIKNEPSFHWLKKLKDVSYDIDDLLNEFYMEAEKHKAEIDGEEHVMAKCFCEKPNSMMFRYKMANKIKTIKESYQAIVAQRRDFNEIRESILMNTIQDRVPKYPSKYRQLVTRELSSLPNVDETTTIFGRDHDKSKIMGELIKTTGQGIISIISIIGLGGSGKTTLAKSIFNDDETVKHFKNRIWVYVSQDFDLEKVIRKLFEAITEKRSEHETLQSMSKKNLDMLSGKRFLLVLDDVWNEDQHQWDKFISHLKGGAAGSRILLTTRSQKVAEIVKSAVPYNLHGLSEDDAWKLFQECSGSIEEELDSGFIEIGKDIVRKCGGLPLAVKALGCIVGNKEGINSWQAVRDSELWNVEDRVFTSLMLSYFHLPSYLQQCFLCCSIFPKGYVIYKHHLIAAWISHGFVTPRNEVEQLEDVGNEYFDSLVKMSFLQDLVEDRDNGIVRCKMHDLVHDLARRVLQDEFVSMPKKVTDDSLPRCRYLSLTQCTENIDRRLLKKARALYVAGGNFTFEKQIKKASYVRTVILEHIPVTTLSPFILKLEYLAYLRISNIQCKELPKAISCCWNLQVLHVTDCARLTIIPESIGKLKKLISLDLSGAQELESLLQSIGDCYNLRSLHLISCANLKDVPNSICKNVNLRVLNLSRCISLKELPSESLGMLQNLQCINLHECEHIKELPDSVIQLGKLQSIKLSSCFGLERLPQCMATLSNLQCLDLRRCLKLVDLPEGIVKLKKLDVLNLEGCGKLHGLPVGIGQLSRLQKLGLFVVGDCSKYARISELESLNMLNDNLRVKNIRNVNGHDDDTEKAYLKEKNKLQELRLEWSRSGHEHGMGMEQELTLLNDLQPPSGISKLWICNYPGWQLSHWIVKQSGGPHSHFPRLNYMSLENLPNLKHLVRIVELPSLKTLKLRQMPALESINGGPFPTLMRLYIEEMPNLQELWTTTTTLADGEEDQGPKSHQLVQSSFPCLSELQVEECPRLNVNPSLPSCVESLKLSKSNEHLLLSPASGCSRPLLLKRLQLYGMASSLSGWELLQHLTALEDLGISFCRDLRQLPDTMRNLTALQQLNIRLCPALWSLPDWLGELQSLRRLDIFSCDSLSSLPQSMAHLTSLQHLAIDYCAALQLPEWEWLGELSALEELSIKSCPGIKLLPSSIQRLTSLQQLYIWSCPDLELRCRRGEGQDWHLISHIPSVRIDGQLIS